MLEQVVCICGLSLGLPILLAYLAARSRPKGSARVRKLFLHPIKSCGSLEVDEGFCTPMGLETSGLIDRSFRVYSYDDRTVHRMLSIKTSPTMSLIKPEILPDNLLKLRAPNMQPFVLSYRPDDYRNGLVVQAKNYSEYETMIDCGDAVAEWISQALNDRSLRLGYSGFWLEDKMTAALREQRDVYERQLLSQYCAPLHLVSLASLQDVAKRATRQLPEAQFRQPILIEGCAAFAEDNFRDIHIGGARLYKSEPCERCAIINNNPDKGEQWPENEPLKTLKTYRKASTSGGPIFGIKVAVTVPGKISVGDAVYTTYQN